MFYFPAVLFLKGRCAVHYSCTRSPLAQSVTHVCMSYGCCACVVASDVCEWRRRSWGMLGTCKHVRWEWPNFQDRPLHSQYFCFFYVFHVRFLHDQNLNGKTWNSTTVCIHHTLLLRASPWIFGWPALLNPEFDCQQFLKCSVYSIEAASGLKFNTPERAEVVSHISHEWRNGLILPLTMWVTDISRSGVLTFNPVITSSA